ncbi:MAG: hypothetical protein ABDH20_05250 [Thermus sp.]
MAGFNRYDLLALALTLALLALLLRASAEVAGPFTPAAISLDPARLPEYALRTAFRMGLALLLPRPLPWPTPPWRPGPGWEPFLDPSWRSLVRPRSWAFWRPPQGLSPAFFPVGPWAMSWPRSSPLHLPGLEHGL